MATKNISIMDDVYKLLLMNKLKEESFSDVIRRCLSKERDIMKFAGIWDSEYAEDIEKIMKKQRENSNSELKKRVNF